jgi:hypothetical protein
MSFRFAPLSHSERIPPPQRCSPYRRGAGEWGHQTLNKYTFAKIKDVYAQTCESSC